MNISTQPIVEYPTETPALLVDFFQLTEWQRLIMLSGDNADLMEMNLINIYKFTKLANRLKVISDELQIYIKDLTQTIQTDIESLGDNQGLLKAKKAEIERIYGKLLTYLFNSNNWAASIAADEGHTIEAPDTRENDEHNPIETTDAEEITLVTIHTSNQLSKWSKDLPAANQVIIDIVEKEVTTYLENNKINLDKKKTNSLKVFLARTALQQGWGNKEIIKAIRLLIPAIIQLRKGPFNLNQFNRAMQDALNKLQP